MALQPRRFLQKPEKIDQKYATPCYMCYICPDDCSSYLSPPPPPQPPPKQHQISTILILMICVLTSAFLLLSYLAIRRYRSRRRNSSSSYLGNGVFREDFIDENQGQGPVLDHHIWFIRTVGLSQPLIDSIPVFRYENGEGLIEGRDCSVCLSEFEEDDSLRILPKCSHAFHLPCIDTWLRSHKNCPVCRAPISIDTDTDTYTGRVDSVEMDPGSGSREENRPGSETDESMETRGVVENRNFMLLKDRFRVLSDLADHHRVPVDRDLKPVRRSLSMDFSYGSMICTKKDEESSGVEMAIVEKQNLEMISKRGSRNTIVCNNKLMTTYSHGCLVQK